eukprot:5876811-Amphidinium_carterae.2
MFLYAVGFHWTIAQMTPGPIDLVAGNIYERRALAEEGVQQPPPDCRIACMQYHRVAALGTGATSDHHA